MIGIITAMRAEARCITLQNLPIGQIINLGGNAIICLSGIGSKAAQMAAIELQNKGATALVSFGIAGALDANLNPGDLILPESIYAGYSLPVALDWRTRLQQCLPSNLHIIGGTLAESQCVLTSIDEKYGQAEVTGACAVDMESAAIARVAANASMPFLAIRAIADPLKFSPPNALIDAIRPDGSADLLQVLSLLLRRTVNLSTLFRLSAELRMACSTLSTVTQYAGIELGINSNYSTITPNQSS